MIFHTHLPSLSSSKLLFLLLMFNFFLPLFCALSPLSLFLIFCLFALVFVSLLQAVLTCLVSLGYLPSLSRNEALKANDARQGLLTHVLTSSEWARTHGILFC